MSDGLEEQLVSRLKRRDEAAFNELVELYQTRIFRLVFRMLGDHGEAEDLAQEVFITVFKRIDSFRGESKLSTWMYRIATNHCKNRIKFLKRRAKGRKQEFDEIADGQQLASATMNPTNPLPRPDEMAEGRQTEHIIKTALANLSEEQRTLIVLRDIENMAYSEIKSVTGLAEGTVKSRLHRARAALKEQVVRLQSGSTPEGGDA